MENNVTVNSDGKLLHFLKELPGWVVVSGALIFFTAIYMTTRDDFIPRILDALIGAFLGLVVAQRPKPPGNTSVVADNINTPEVRTESMDNASIRAENVTQQDSSSSEREAR